MDRSISYKVHFELKPKCKNVDLSLRAQRYLKESKINIPSELINFCDQHGIEGLARLSRIGNKSYAEIEEFLKDICY